MAAPSPSRLLEDYLAERGLTQEHAKRLKLKPLTAEQVKRLGAHYLEQAAVQIPYHTPTGAPMSDRPACPPYYRLRYLGASNKPAAIAGGKAPRYVQPPDTAPCAYYPRLIDWEHALSDPTVPVLITEGEIKAAKACAEGFHCIGIGGVHSWRALRQGIEFLSSLELLDWRRRRVWIVYDSDARTNEQVARALREACEAWVARGAIVYVVFLPELPGLKKVGLDDYLVVAGSEALKALLGSAVPYGLTRVLWGLNDRYVYVRDPGLVACLDTGARLTPGALREHQEAHRTYHEIVLGNDGEPKVKAVAAGGAWLTWPCRREVRRLTYAPGAPAEIDGDLNTWPGWGSTPRQGDVSPWRELLDHLFTGEPAARVWFEQWCAYPIQHPGAKLYTASVIWGAGQGTGKTLIGYTLGRVYGKNFAEIGHKDLEGGFNEWAVGRQFVLGDDVAGKDRRQDADALKRLITQSEVRVNQKFVPSYSIPDTINYLFTSNHPDALYLEDDDRRYFCHQVTVPALPPEFYRRYDAWYRSEAGAGALHHHLLHLDLGDFDPRARAPVTASKRAMQAQSLSELGSWVRALLDDPDAVLRTGEVVVTGRDLFTAQELLELYDPIRRTGTTPGGVARELARAGAHQALKGALVTGRPGAVKARYWIVRRPEVWREAKLQEVTEHLRGPAAPKGRKF